MAEPPARPPDDDETVVVPPEEAAAVPADDETVVDPDWRVPPERRVVVAETREEPAPPPPPRRIPRLWPALLALLVLVLAGIGAAYYLSRDDEDDAAPATTASQRVEVPLLVGLTEERAQERLRDAALEADVERRESEEPEGIVVEQDPAEGTQVESGETVQIVVSEGPGEAATTGTTTSAQPELVRVPEVVGMRSSEATARLREAGFDVRLVGVPSDEPEGTVVAQSPVAGAEAEEGSSVRLNVAQGGGTTQPTTTAEPEPATVPDVVGQELAEAARAFGSEGLKVSVRYVPSSEAQGRVVAQAQPPGTELRRGDTVQLNVSEGAEPAEEATVPGVVGRTNAEARQALEQAGFEVLAIDLQDEVRNEDEVASQSPAGGAAIPRGSLVLLYLSR